MITYRVQGIEPLVKRMQAAPDKWKEFTQANFDTLGRRVAYLMRQELKSVKYTGATEQSVTHAVDVGNMRVSIYPQTPQSLWIRTGTRPHWAPIEPLKRWAAVKLGSEKAAYKVQWSIARHGTSMQSVKVRGTKENPYPERTLGRGDTQVAIQNTAMRFGADLAAWIGGEG